MGPIWEDRHALHTTRRRRIDPCFYSCAFATIVHVRQGGCIEKIPKWGKYSAVRDICEYNARFYSYFYS